MNLFMSKTYLPGTLLGTKTIRTNRILRNFKSNGKENQTITNKCIVQRPLTDMISNYPS